MRENFFSMKLGARHSTPWICAVVGILLLLQANSVSGQPANSKGTPYKIKADSLSRKKEYKAAARAYVTEYDHHTLAPFRKQALVNAAHGYAAANMPDSALYLLDLAARKYGFSNRQLLLTDSIFLRLKPHKKYNQLITHLNEESKKLTNPAKAVINTSDIDLFWKVYDRFLADTSQAQELFLSQYFEKGTPALQQYYILKTGNIGGIKGFVRNMATMRKFYAGIRSNTNQVKYLEDSVRTVYNHLKNVYPAAVYPPLTFVIGGWSSGGTSTEYGLLVGADMYANNESTDKSELNAWQKRNGNLFKNLKNVVAHELVHAQQQHLKKDTILLKYAIEEGMADFIGELISGQTANVALHQLTKGKEKKIWEAFKKEMYLDRYSNWIANSSQERADWPADLGYWVGYQICKAYFDEAENKKQAIDDMLHIQDYRAFLAKSKFDEKVNRLY
jgi:hypothetical protein